MYDEMADFKGFFLLGFAAWKDLEQVFLFRDTEVWE